MKIRFHILLLITILVFSHAFADREDDYNFARKLYNDGYYDLAVKQYNKFIENYPDDVRVPFAYYMCGKALVLLEKFDEARSAFLRVALDFPDNKYAPESFYLSADCLKKQKRWKEAARGFLILSDYYPKSEFAPRAMVEAGMIYRLLDDMGEAQSAFERIVKLYPGTASASMAYFNLAEIAESRNELTDALWKFQMAKQTAENETVIAQTAIRRALIMFRNGDWALAELELKQVLTPPEFSIYAQMLEAIWLQKRGDFKSAQEKLLNLVGKVNVDTLNKRINFYLGDNYFYQGDLQTALEYYNEAPISDSLELRIGFTYMKLDIVKQAVSAFAQVLKLEGEVTSKISALENLSDLYSKGAETAEVTKLLTSYLSKLTEIPNWDRFAAGMGILAFKEGNYQTAEDFLAPIEKIISVWSDDAHYYLARIGEVRKDSSKAISAYESFIKKYPGSDYIQDAENRLNKLKEELPEANLLGSIAALSSASISFKTRGELALNWGRLYCQGFKDYMKGCEQLNLALSTNELTTKESAEALDLLANALLKRSASEPALQDSALKTMQKYLEIASSGSSAGTFSLKLLQHQVASIPKREKAQKTYFKGLEEILEKYKIDKIIPEVLTELARVGVNEVNEPLKSIEYSFKLENDYPKNPLNQFTLLSRAQAKLALEDTAGAIADLKSYIEKYPHGVDIFTVSLKSAELNQNLNEKIAIVKDMVKKFYYHSQTPYLIEYLGDLYVLANDYLSAFEQYDLVAKEIITPMPIGGGSEVEYKLGMVWQRMGNLGEAQSHYFSYAVNHPNGKHWEEALMALAEISETEERPSDALKFYQNLVSHTENKLLSQTALERIAAISYKMGNYQSGRDLYLQMALNVDDDKKKMEYEAQAIVGLYRQDMMEIARTEALNFARKYSASSLLNTYQALFYLEKGKAQTREKNFKEALKTLKFALSQYKNSPSNPETEYEIGKIYLITNQYDDALQILTKIPETYPHHPIIPSVYLSLGTFYYRQSQYQNALIALQKVLDDPAGRSLWPSALQNLELTYKDLGLYDAALSIVNRYLEMYPFDEDAILKKIDAAQLLINLREYDRAIERLKALLPIVTPEMMVEVQFYIGEAYFQKGDFQQAVLEYMKVKYLDPGGGLDWAVTAVYNSGLCYEKLSRYDEAKNMYREIIDRFGAASDYGKAAQKRIDMLEKR